RWVMHSREATGCASPMRAPPRRTSRREYDVCPSLNCEGNVFKNQQLHCVRRFLCCRRRRRFGFILLAQRQKTNMKQTLLSLSLGWLYLPKLCGAAEPLDLWAPQYSGTTQDLVSVAYGNGQFVAAGDSFNIYTSPTG